jgi:hypothetical protein
MRRCCARKGGQDFLANGKRTLVPQVHEEAQHGNDRTTGHTEWVVPSTIVLWLVAHGQLLNSVRLVGAVGLIAAMAPSRPRTTALGPSRAPRSTESEPPCTCTTSERSDPSGNHAPAENSRTSSIACYWARQSGPSKPAGFTVRGALQVEVVGAASFSSQ